MFHSQSVGEINTELKNNTILLSFKKDFFGAKKKTVSTFWREKWLFLFLSSKNKQAFSVLLICWGDLKGQNRWLAKRMKVSYDHYETLLHVFTPNSVRQVLAKFLHLSLKELWTQNKRFQEWSKIRVSCFFWQIKLGRNKEFWTQANVFESNFTSQANAVWSQSKLRIDKCPFLCFFSQKNILAR